MSAERTKAVYMNDSIICSSRYSMLMLTWNPNNTFTHTVLQYTPYLLRGPQGTDLHFLLCDTPGIENTTGLELIEANFLLDGHVPDFHQVGGR